MNEYIEPFKAEEGVTTANFNSRIGQMNSALSAAVPKYGTEDIEAGSASTEPEGSLHFVIE